MTVLRVAILSAFLFAVCAVGVCPARAASGWENCGSKRGAFPIAGAPGLTGLVFVKAHDASCEKALDFGHALFFGQECVYCDDPASYSPGERFRFRGFRCEAYRGQPQRFHCVRGERVINVRTDIDQI